MSQFVKAQDNAKLIEARAFLAVQQEGIESSPTGEAPEQYGYFPGLSALVQSGEVAQVRQPLVSLSRGKVPTDGPTLAHTPASAAAVTLAESVDGLPTVVTWQVSFVDANGNRTKWPMFRLFDYVTPEQVEARKAQAPVEAESGVNTEPVEMTKAQREAAIKAADHARQVIESSGQTIEVFRRVARKQTQAGLAAKALIEAIDSDPR